MQVLAIDSAGSSCCACLWQDGAVLAVCEEKMERGQDQRLIPLILEVMKQAKTHFHFLDRIGVTRGPGSFTGLRIGLAAARGLGFAAGKPVIGIDRFAIFRHALEPNRDTLIVIQSKRAELFCQFFPANSMAQTPYLMTLTEVLSFQDAHPGLCIGGDVDSLPGFQTMSIGDVVICARLAAAADIDDPIYLPRPLYLRPPDVTQSKTPAYSTTVNT